MMRLAEAREHIGQDVIYHRPSGGEDQYGVIVDVGDVFVYVRYDRADPPKGTSPEQLTLAPPADPS